MVYCIFGESCTGKSTLAEKISKKNGAVVYTGRDYLRLAKNEDSAKAAFRALLSAPDAAIVFVSTEKE